MGYIILIIALVIVAKVFQGMWSRAKAERLKVEREAYLNQVSRKSWTGRSKYDNLKEEEGQRTVFQYEPDQNYSENDRI